MNRKAPATLLGLALCLSFPSFAALCQTADTKKPLEDRSRLHDYRVGGVLFRVPGPYIQPASVARKPEQVLRFVFWVSDGEPLWNGVRGLPEKDRTRRAMYWPDEPGRPSFGSEDFLVHVVAAPLSPEKGMQRQAQLRDRAVGSGQYALKIEDGLQCYIRQNESKGCVSSIGDDPDVNMAFYGSPKSSIPAWRLQLYSRTDGLSAVLDFPLVGQALWPEAVCRTLGLLRAWRVSGGPPPKDCSELHQALHKETPQRTP